MTNRSKSTSSSEENELIIQLHSNQTVDQLCAHTSSAIDNTETITRHHKRAVDTLHVSTARTTQQLHCVSKKLPPFNSLQLCQIFTDFQNFCSAGKRMKFATKPIRHYPPHLRHVAALPREIKNSNFQQIFSRYRRKCKQIAF